MRPTNIRRAPAVLGFIEQDDTQDSTERFSTYSYKFFNYSKKNEKQLMATYREQYLVNPLVTLFVDYLAMRLGKPRLAGVSQEKIDQAQEALDEVGFWDNFYMTVHQTVLNGTGIMVKNHPWGKFRRTDTSQWNITRDDNTGIVSYTLTGGAEVEVEWQPNEVANSDLVVFRFIELPDRPEGISFLRHNLHALASLKSIIFEDIPSGVHNFLTVERILQMPLDGYNTEAEQKTLFQDMRDRWENRDPSGIGITILDDKVKAGYMGTLDGQSAGLGNRVIDISKFIEPILSTVMLNFCAPLGILLQTGANKSLMKRQEAECNLRLNVLRERLWDQTRIQVWPDFNLDPNEVWLEWPITEPEMMDEWSRDREMYERQIISKEYVHMKYGIKDEGTTFYEGAPTAATPNSNDETDAEAESHRDE